MESPVNRPRAAQIERGGAAVTLEVSEPLFQLAAALNVCGYDADLSKSAPVRAKVRADMNAALVFNAADFDKFAAIGLHAAILAASQPALAYQAIKTELARTEKN